MCVLCAHMHGARACNYMCGGSRHAKVRQQRKGIRNRLRAHCAWLHARVEASLSVTLHLVFGCKEYRHWVCLNGARVYVRVCVQAALAKREAALTSEQAKVDAARAAADKVAAEAAERAAATAAKESDLVTREKAVSPLLLPWPLPTAPLHAEAPICALTFLYVRQLRRHLHTYPLYPSPSRPLVAAHTLLHDTCHDMSASCEDK